jgi:hypothetical protein
MYLPTPREVLSQGDIFLQLDLVDSAAPTALPQKRNVIVISHDCEIDKPHNRIILVCGLIPLSNVNQGHQGNIKKNSLANTMYIEPVQTLVESYVDFRYIFRADKLYLEEAMRQGLRIASIDNETQLALGTFFYRFLTRKLPSITPPWLQFFNRISSRISFQINRFLKKS